MRISQESEGDVGSAGPPALTGGDPPHAGADALVAPVENNAEHAEHALSVADRPDPARVPARLTPDDAPPRHMKRDGARDPASPASDLDANRAEQASRCDIQGAIAFDVPDRRDPDVARGRRRIMPTRSQEAEIDDTPQTGADELEQTGVIAGIDDRTSYLAMVAAPGTATLRPPRLLKTSGVSKVRSKSQAQCERRCGGACDGMSCPGCAGVDGNRLPDAV
jgi:hypothetical protein